MAQLLSYEDLFLQLVANGSTSYHILARCGDEEERGTFVPPAECWRSSAPVSGGTRDLLSSGVAKPPPSAARETGDRLFRALLPGRVRDLFQRAVGHTERRPRTGLRLRIQLDYRDPHALPLADMPWELLFWAEGHGFLALSRTSPVIRSAVVPRAVRVPALAGPLDILAVAASPRGLPELDLTRERHGIEAALAGRASAHATFIEPAGALDLQRTWSRKAFQVLHFMGHGSFDEVSGHGQLLLTGTDRSPEVLTDNQLVELLDRDAPPALVVLNACHGADGHPMPEGYPAGLAPSMILAGLPAVVAMNRAIPDAAAIAWSSAFYGSLSSGHALEAAVAEGRKAIHSLNPSGMDWVVPALFLGNAQSRLAEVMPQPSISAASADPARRTRVHVGDIEDIEELVLVGRSRRAPARDAAVPSDERSAEAAGPDESTSADSVELHAGDVRQVRKARIVASEETS